MENGNPYAGGPPAPQPRNGAVAVQAAHAAAEVQAQIALAKQFPRNEARSMDRILNECSRATVAEKGVYGFPRGGVTVTGPSIRLAEAIARSWGNIASGFTVVERTENESTVIAYAWDLETNAMERIEFKVSHIRHTKKGDYAITDDRDLYELEANQAARRRRACILAVIPGDVVDAAVERCRRTLDASVEDIKEARNKMVDSFGAFGVTKEMIERRIGRRIDAIQPGEIVALRGIFNSLKEGTATAGDFFEAVKKPEDVIPQVPASLPPPQRTPDATDAGSDREQGAGFSPEDGRDGENAEELVLALEEYLAAGDGLPEACKTEIGAALAADERDVNRLSALLEKAKAACDGGRR
ncbi:MAG: hypothetical protein LBD24_05520 [Spirochaetaceae bacterium]|jgi:hypothetical protein|nr:hypothetical protein [Spirochaetaceae bacterium]